MKTEAYKLYSRVFWIFLPNFIKIAPCNFELYRFKVNTFFETQCSTDCWAVRAKIRQKRPSRWLKRQNWKLKYGGDPKNQLLSLVSYSLLQTVFSYDISFRQNTKRHDDRRQTDDTVCQRHFNILYIALLAENAHSRQKIGILKDLTINVWISLTNADTAHPCVKMSILENRRLFPMRRTNRRVGFRVEFRVIFRVAGTRTQTSSHKFSSFFVCTN